MNTHRLALAFVCLLALGGCGGGSSTTGTIDDFSVATPGTLTTSNTSLSGTGSVVFVNPLAGPSAKSSFRITLALGSDTSQVDLIVNASAALANGAVIRFVRNGNALKAGKPGLEQTIPGADAAQAVTLQIDVHNDEGHLQIWREDKTEFTTTNADLDIEPGIGTSIDKGTGGSVWGLTLTGATVTRANASGAKNPNA